MKGHFLFLTLTSLLLVGCVGAVTPDIEPTVQVAIATTPTVQSTETPTRTRTRDVESTVQLATSATRTARPTEAPMPTPTGIPAPTPTREPTPTSVPPTMEPFPPFTHTLQTYRGSGFSFQCPAGARVEHVAPSAMAWQRTSSATDEIRVTGPQVWVQPGDADWSYRGPAYELSLRTYENPKGLDAEAWARDYLRDAWREAREQKRPWGALPMTEAGEIDEDKVGRVTVAGQPAFWVSYFGFDSTWPAYYVSAGQQILELSFRLYPVANQPLATVQWDMYAMILNTLHLEGEATRYADRAPLAGLTIEAYALEGPPHVEPLTFVPLQGTQEMVLAKREQERGKTFPNNSVLVDGQHGLSAQLGDKELVVSTLFTDVVTARGVFQQVTVQVSRNGEPMYSIPAGDGGPIGSLQGLWTYSDHWVLEIALVTQTMSSENGISLNSVGQIVRDGELLNERQGYEEAFGFQLMNGKPFYFFRRSGQIGISFDDQEMILGYSRVPHHECCSAGELNPRKARNMAAFFAQRDEGWYYVEIGGYE